VDRSSRTGRGRSRCEEGVEEVKPSQGVRSERTHRAPRTSVSPSNPKRRHFSSIYS
jgi:hypothetical protein